MPGASNFLTVTLSTDKQTLTVSGTTEGTLVDVFASVVMRPPADERVQPRTEQTGLFVGNVVPSQWKIKIANDGATPFESGDILLVAGAALHEGGERDVWADSIELVPASGT